MLSHGVEGGYSITPPGPSGFRIKLIGGKNPFVLSRVEMDSTVRSTRWSFTAYEPQYGLLENMPDLVAEWGWQDEVCPQTDRRHRQGYIRTHTQQRFSALKRVLPGIHIEIARNWQALLEYCKKDETRDASGNQVHQVNPREYLTLDRALMRIANVWNDVRYARNCQADYLAFWKKTVEDVLKEEFNAAICVLVAENPGDVSYYVRPDVWRAWSITHSVWLRRRQTDTVTRISTAEYLERSGITDASDQQSVASASGSS